MKRKMANGQHQQFPTQSTRVHGRQRLVESSFETQVYFIQKWQQFPYDFDPSLCRKLRTPTTRENGRHHLLTTQVGFHLFCIESKINFLVLCALTVWSFNPFYRFQGRPQSLRFPQFEICGNWTMAGKKISTAYLHFMVIFMQLSQTGKLDG